MAEKEEGDEGSQDTQGSGEYEVELEVPEWLTDFFKDPYNIAFVVVLLIAIYFRVVNLDVTSMWPDTANHLWLTETFLSSEMLAEVAYQGSLLFITITKILSFFTYPFLAGKLTSLLYSIVGITAIYFLGREVAGEEAGLAAAFVLSFIPVFWFQSTRPLLDSNLTAVVTLVMLCLVKYEKTQKRSWAIALALSMLATSMTKLAGVLVFPAVGLYYILAYRLELWNMLKERRDFQIFAGLVIAVGIALMVFNYFSAGVVTGRTGGKLAEKSATSSGGFPFHSFYIKQIPNLLFGTSSLYQGSTASYYNVLLTLFFILPLIGLGSYVAFKKFSKDQKSVIFFYIVSLAWLAFFSQHGVKSPRYALPAIPAILLIMLIGVPKIIGRFKWEVLVAAVFIVAFAYPAGAGMIQNKAVSYTGYQEAGTYIRQNMGENDIVIAGAKRQTRLFTGSAYVNHGGQVTNNRWNSSEFPRKIQEFKKKYDGIWLLVDRWEYTQPDWAYPLNQKKLKWIQAAGFELAHVVRKRAPTKQGLKPAPVAFVFKYTGAQPEGSAGS